VNKNIYIIETNDDLLSIKDKINDRNKIFLLSSDFNFEEIKINKDLKFYDEKLIGKKSLFLSNQIHNIYSAFFKSCLNTSNKSSYNPGMVFQGSIRILLCTLLKYDFFIKNELLKGDKIYVSPNANKFFLSVLNDYRTKHGLQYSIIKTINQIEDINNKFIGKISFDKDGRFRNLSSINFKNKFSHNLFNLLFKLIKI